MPRIIVERNFDSPVTDESLKSLMERMGPCLEIYKVKWVRSHLATDRKRMMCEYDAADAESVRTVQRESKAKFDRVWVAEVLGAN
jgi:hypothetical protein